MLYMVRQEYIHNNKNILYELHHLTKDTEQYKELPAKVSSSVLLLLQKNFKSYFKSNADYKKNPHKYTGKPHLPKYLDKENGRFVASFTNQAISKKIFKKHNKIKLSGFDIEIKTKINDFNIINCVRVVPHLGYYTIEIIYTTPDTEQLSNNDRYYSIDLGVNNLSTVTSNVKEITPFIINGKPLKSINQYYNKKRSELRSKLGYKRDNNGNDILDKLGRKVQIKRSKRLDKLELKRNNKVNNYLHKASKEIVSSCKEKKVNTIIIGKNDNWKQDVNNGKRNNQNFVNIPHSRFIDMIKYKCEKEGINVILQEESYTSKASFLNLDYIPTYNENDSTEYTFSGYRKYRGLYKIKGENKSINADVNGSYNILRKAVPNAFADGIEGIGVYPKVLTLK